MPHNAKRDLDEVQSLALTYTQDGRAHCPACSHERKKKHEKTLSLTVHPDRVLYDCHHCNISGVVHYDGGRDYVAEMREKQEKKVTKLPTKLNKDTDLIQQFFTHRGVTLDDVSALPLRTGKKYFPSLKSEVEAIGFVYGDRNAPSAVKWRPLDGTKTFTQDGAARDFYGLDMLPDEAKTLIITEGEADVIALASIGIPAISIPNGAQPKYKNTSKDDNKFSYLWDAKELVDGAEKVILAVDNDEAGDALAEELAHRIGRAKCWRTDFGGHKDANGLLEKTNADAVKTAIDKSEPMPLSGVYQAEEYFGALEEIYLKGHGKGETTGYANIDKLFTVQPGNLYICTGLPGSGKSEFLDQIMINLAGRRGWKWAVSSFENQPHIHIAKLSEKVIGKPFFSGVTPRMNKDDLAEAKEFINDHFVFLQSRDGNLMTIEAILSRISDAIMRLGCKAAIIDPYNYIAQVGDKSEHKQIEEMLTRLIAFAQARDIAIFFVAHPMKIYPRDDGTMPVPTGMHISGSAAWFAKADIGFTVHRSTAGVEIHCWKMRHKWLGEVGCEFLDYDVPTGRYFVPRDLEERRKKGPGLSKRNRRHKKVEDDKPEDFDDIDLDNLEF